MKRPVWNPADYQPPPEYVDDGPPTMTSEERLRFEAQLDRDPNGTRDDPFAAWPGGKWIFDRPELPPAIWGEGGEVAWPEGEAMMLVGPDGTGKTVLADNLITRMIGIDQTPLLGLPVQPRARVLYLAQDRPSQAARAFRRLVGTVDRLTLDMSLMVIDWPIEPFDSNPASLLKLVKENGCDTVIVDSVKDVVTEPSSEKSGLALKTAYQLCIADGVEVCLLHHDRKPTQEGRSRRLLKLADVYGSRFAVAGCGSVIALNGGSGDPLIELRHLKQPAGEVGPLRFLLDFETGEVAIYDGSDLFSVLLRAKDGLTAQDAARIIYETDKPSNAERERARRKLKHLAGKGKAHEVEAHGQEPARFYLTVDLTPPLTHDLTEGQP